jgi:hypothetical protein
MKDLTVEEGGSQAPLNSSIGVTSLVANKQCPSLATNTHV